MSNKLFLRSLNSPYNDETRGSVLSIQDMDNNLIHLKGLTSKTLTFNGEKILLEQLNGSIKEVNISEFNNLIVNGSLSATTLYGDGSQLFGVENFYVTGATINNGNLILDRNDILSAVTVDLNNILNDGNGTTVNGLSVDLGGNLSSDVFIDGISGSSSMYLGSSGPDKQLNSFSVGANNGIQLFNYQNNIISSSLNLNNNSISLSSGISGNTVVIGGQVLVGSYDNRRFTIILYGNGIPLGSGDSFTINGTTFQEGVDFIGQGDTILDAETIYNLNYSGVTNFISTNYTPGDIQVTFNFSEPATIFFTLTNGTIVENIYSTQFNTSSLGAFMTSGDNGLIIGRNDGSHIFNDATQSPKGLQYGGNYDNTLEDDSLIPKRYVDNIISGITDTNFANTDLTFNSNRIHNLSGYTFNINNGVTEVFRINTFNDVIARGKGDNTNTHFGLNVLRSDSTGIQNTIYGQDITGIISGQVNSYFGFRAGRVNNGTGNSFFGGFAGLDLTTGNNNVIIGRSAAFSTNTGGTVSNLENSIVIGETARVLNSGDVNTIVIGRNSRGLGSNTVVLGNSDITRTQLRGRVEMDTTTDGILLPRLTTLQMNAISSPSTNLLVFNTDLNGLYRYNGSSWVALSTGYGIIGVYSGSGNGTPTFFATLQDALETCKSSGGYFTVKLYSNITITSSILIDYTGSGVGGAYLFRQLTIDLNGFNITNNQTDSSHCFDLRPSNNVTVHQEIRFLNGNVIRTNGTGTHYALKFDQGGRFGTIQMSKMFWYCQNSNCANMNIASLSTQQGIDKVCDLGGSTFVSQNGYGIFVDNSTIRLKNFNVISHSTNYALGANSGDISYFTAENTSTGRAINVAGTVKLRHFEGYSNSGAALFITNGVATNFYVRSVSGRAIEGDIAIACNISNFVAETGNNFALKLLAGFENNTNVTNGKCINNSATIQCVDVINFGYIHNIEATNLGAGVGLIAGSNQAGRMEVSGCKGISIGGIGGWLYATGTGIVLNATLNEFCSRLNTSDGHALRVSGTGRVKLTHTNMLVRNSGANAINATSAVTVDSRYCTHNDVASTPINANVTIVSSGIIS